MTRVSVYWIEFYQKNNKKTNKKKQTKQSIADLPNSSSVEVSSFAVNLFNLTFTKSKPDKYKKDENISKIWKYEILVYILLGEKKTLTSMNFGRSKYFKHRKSSLIWTHDNRFVWR